MPELPEVEIIKTELSSNIINSLVLKTYSKNITLRNKLIPDVSILIDQKIKKIERRNKYIIVKFDKNLLIIHLGMTGKLIFEKNLNLLKHTHFYLELNNGFLTYTDARRFGLIDIFDINTSLDNISYTKNLGIEPLGNNFNYDLFYILTKKHKTNIKKFLMDSNIICGIGNIYASEILFLSKVSPERLTTTLNNNEIKLIFDNIIFILNKAISLGGSSISDFVHTNGSSGEMQNFYNVYNRYNEDCKICSNKILRIKQYGRSTYYCQSCQK